MFLPNKVKSIAAVSLLSLGGLLGFQALLASKAHAQSQVPMICNQGKCDVRIRLNQKQVSIPVDAVIVPNTYGILIPRPVLANWALKGWGTGDFLNASNIRLDSITIGDKKYSTTAAKIVSSGNQVMIGGKSLRDWGFTVNTKTDTLIFP